MTSLAPMSQSDDASIAPTARIDTQDAEFIIPLREYLESNGCHVVLNGEPGHHVIYDIAVGDQIFVKSIFAVPSVDSIRRLGIIIGSFDDDGTISKKQNVKIVCVDPVYLSQKDVIEIFSFFFAGIDATYDKRRTPHEQIAPKQALSEVLVTPVHIKSVEISTKKVSPVVTEDSQNLLSAEDSTRINTIMSEVFHDTQTKSKKTLSKKFKKITKSFRKYYIHLLLLLYIVFAPFFWYGTSLLITTFSFGRAGELFQNGDNTNALRSASFGTYWLKQSTLSFSFIKIPLVLTGAIDLTRRNERILSLFSDVSQISHEAKALSDQVKQVASYMKNSNDHVDIAPAVIFDRLRRTTEETHNRLGLAEAQLQVLRDENAFPFSVPLVSAKATKAIEVFQSARTILSSVNTALLLYPKIAGFSEPKTILVLLQNSNELRPTGGFIGSVGIAKFEEGLLSDFSIQDVYALDGQLKGHVDPPKPIRELLGNEHWYLRDSNWSPDFKISGTQAAWFYEKETGVKVDGVVAVNVPFVIDVLQAIGPVHLPDYNDRISADNFFGKSFYYTQNNFFPGSTQKKDFLGTLFRAIITKIMTDSDAGTIGLFTAFTDGISHRDIAFMFEDPELQSIIEHFQWGGRVYSDLGCESENPTLCLHDPVLISEANVSVSKINYFIERSGSREITIAPDGTISETIHIYISNNVNLSPDVNTPGIGGAYRSYLRFIVPADSLVGDVRVDNKKVVSRDKADTTVRDVPYIETAEGVDGAVAIGVAFAVMPGVKNNLMISYTRGNKMQFNKAGGMLETTWYKQPGVRTVDLKTIVRYPLYWNATNISEPSGASKIQENTSTFVAKDGELEYNTQVQTDQKIRVKFTL